jgi:heme exporter protein D
VSEFLAMGGYAFYVWSSYAAGALVLAWNVVAPLRARRELLRSLAADRR